MKISLQELKSMTLEQRLSAFVCWLGAQNRDTPYFYTDAGNCAICQFAKSVLCESKISSGGRYFRFNYGEEIPVIPGGMFSDLANALRNCTTLGALYDCLSPHVTPPLLPTVELSEAALEALELRPLVSFERTKA